MHLYCIERYRFFSMHEKAISSYDLLTANSQWLKAPQLSYYLSQIDLSISKALGHVLIKYDLYPELVSVSTESSV